MHVVAGAVDCELAEGMQEHSVLAGGWLSESGKGRLTGRLEKREREREREGERSTVGWLLSVDGHCRCIDLSTNEDTKHTMDRGYVRCSGNESRPYPLPLIRAPSHARHLHRAGHRSTLVIICQGGRRGTTGRGTSPSGSGEFVWRGGSLAREGLMVLCGCATSPSLPLAGR